MDIFTILVRSVLTSEPHQVSLLFFLWYVHSGNGLVRLASVTGGAQVPIEDYSVIAIFLFVYSQCNYCYSLLIFELIGSSVQYQK